MSKCWELRPCDEEMQSRCPHATDDEERCPAKCAFALCDRPDHRITTDPALVFDATVDATAAIKESCLFCEFFIRNGPRS